jgi:hypothetical protein
MSPRTQTAATFVLSAIAAAATTALLLFVVLKDTGFLRGTVTEARAWCAVSGALAGDEPMTLDGCVDGFESLDDEYQDMLWEQAA